MKGTKHVPKDGHKQNKPGQKQPVSKADAQVTGLSGWHEVSALEAEYLLHSFGESPGTYLIRPSATSEYALSVNVQHEVKKRKDCFVQHFDITKGKDGRYCIAQNSWFPTMDKLLDHYREKISDGPNCLLTVPCPKEKDPNASAIWANMECIVLGEKIGSSASSEVFRGIWHGTVPLAVKIKQAKENLLAVLLGGTKLFKMSHPNIVHSFGLTEMKENPSTGRIGTLLMEIMENGSLLNYLRNDNGKTLALQQLVGMMIQIASAMTYLESRRIIHCELKASKILVGRDNLVKLGGGFSEAQEFQPDFDEFESGSKKGSAKWLPVEAAATGLYHLKSDIWSFGILLWEMVTYGGEPYNGMKTDKEILDAVDKGYRMPKPTNADNPNGGPVHCDQALYDIMLDCWRATVESRPTFVQLGEFLDAYMKKCKSKP